MIEFSWSDIVEAVGKYASSMAEYVMNLNLALLQ
jgi:hypothetical protein